LGGRLKICGRSSASAGIRLSGRFQRELGTELALQGRWIEARQMVHELPLGDERGLRLPIAHAREVEPNAPHVPGQFAHPTRAPSAH